MNPDKRRVENRYFQGSITTDKPEFQFKEFELGVTTNDFVVDRKTLWNGGDGVEWLLERPRAYLRFQEKNVHMYLGPDAPQHPVNNMPPLDQWIAQETQRLTGIIEQSRNTNFNALLNRFNLPLVEWGQNVNIAHLPGNQQEQYQQELYNITKEYHKDLASIARQTSSITKDYRDAQIDYRKQVDKYDKKCEIVVATFKETFGPAVMVHINELVNARMFHQAWERLHQIYNTNPDIDLKTAIIHKLEMQIYNPKTITVAGMFQKLESLWAPLLMPDQPGYTDGEKIGMVKNAFQHYPELFEKTFDFARRSNSNYEQLKAMVLRDMDYQLLETVKKQNIITRYEHTVKKNEFSNIESISNVTQVKGSIRCYKCGQGGHIAKDCDVVTTTTKDYYNHNQPSNKPMLTTTKIVGQKRNNYSGYSSGGSVSSKNSRASSRSSQSNHSNRSNNRYPKPAIKKPRFTSKDIQSTSSDTEDQNVKNIKNKFLDKIRNSSSRSVSGNNRPKSPKLGSMIEEKPETESINPDFKRKMTNLINKLKVVLKVEDKSVGTSDLKQNVLNNVVAAATIRNAEENCTAPKGDGSISVFLETKRLKGVHSSRKSVVEEDRTSGDASKTITFMGNTSAVCEKPIIGVRGAAIPERNVQIGNAVGSLISRHADESPSKKSAGYWKLEVPVGRQELEVLDGGWSSEQPEVKSFERMNMMEESYDEFMSKIYMDLTLEQQSNFINKVLASDFFEYDRKLDYKIIFDSGCTSHIISDVNMFDLITDITGVIKLPNGQVIKYHGIGEVGILKDVLWVPEVEGSYISCGKLDSEGKTIVIKNGKLIVYDENNEVLFGGRKVNDLYYFDPTITKDELNVLDIRHGSAIKKMKTSIGKMSELDYLHHRMGHCGEDPIINGIKKETIKGILVDPQVVLKQKLSFCPDCIKGKMIRKTLGPSETDYKNAKPMEYMATDTKGPFREATRYGNYRYFDLFVFRSSGYMIVKPKVRKNDFIKNLREVLDWVKRIGHEVKFIQSDDENLYKTEQVKELLRDYGIQKRTSIPYEHWQNGWVERNMRSLLEKATTIMLVYNCLLIFWYDAIETAAKLICWTPSRSLEWDTPHFRVFNEIPDLSHLIPFFSPGLARIPEKLRDNPFSPKAIEVRFLRYDEESKNGYWVYVPSLMKVIRVINCVFDENVDISKEFTDDENRDLSRYKTLDLSHEEFISSDYKFLIEGSIDEDDLYWHEENSDNESTNSITDLNSIIEEMKLPPNPKNITEALSGPDADKWETAIHDEIDQLIEYGAIKIVEPRPDENIAEMKFVLITKFDNDFSIRYKARMVLKGYSQVFGIDYLDTYSPTIGRDSLRIVIVYVLKHEMMFYIYDFKYAFIEGMNDFRIIARLPRELFPKGTEPIYIEALRAFYGEKQAAYIWYQRLKEILLSMGFSALLFDEAIFIKKNNRDEIIMIVTSHVDDLFVASYTNQDQDWFMKEIKKHVRDIVRCENAQKYIGIEIQRINNIMFLSQQKYINKIYEKMDSKEKSIIRRRYYPINPSNKIDDEVQNENNNDRINILPIIGQMRYVIDCTRMDAMGALGLISEKATEATYSQFKMAYSLFSFLYSTSDVKLRLYASRSSDLELFAFCDASHNNGNGQSRLGGVFYLGFDSAPISCFSKKDVTTSNSAMESEIKAIERTIRQVIIYRELLSELGYVQLKPTKIYTDSQASVKFFQQYRNTKKLKHLMKLIHIIRTAINQRQVELVYIMSEYNVADLMTKLLTRIIFSDMERWIMYGYSQKEFEEFLKRSKIKNARRYPDDNQLEDNSMIV